MQVVQPRYAEAIRLATQALEGSLNRDESSRPLPYMFGSPEYLQVILSAFCRINAIFSASKPFAGFLCLLLQGAVCGLLATTRMAACMHCSSAGELLGINDGDECPCRIHTVGLGP